MVWKDLFCSTANVCINLTQDLKTFKSTTSIYVQNAFKGKRPFELWIFIFFQSFKTEDCLTGFKQNKGKAEENWWKELYCMFTLFFGLKYGYV